MSVRFTMKKLAKALHAERFWLVGEKATKIELSRTVGDRVVTVELTPGTVQGKVHLSFPSYLFQSKISHWSPTEDEIRLTRSKSILTSLVKTLRRSIVWDFVENKDFIKVNPYFRGKKTKIKEELLGVVG